MIILGIETSCDETAISIIETEGKIGEDFKLKILANETLSQIELHRKYGGVFPTLAKREHSLNLTPLFIRTINTSGLLKELVNKNHESSLPFEALCEEGNKGEEEGKNNLTTLNFSRSARSSIARQLKSLLAREPEMWQIFEKEILPLEKPKIDVIAVTKGPGLEPALWTGINFAKALSLLWQIPIIPINHMEGHILVSLLKSETKNHESRIMNQEKEGENENEEVRIKNKGGEKENEELGIKNRGGEEKEKKENLTSYNLQPTTHNFPSLALLISGGHTELVLMKDWFKYEIIGKTKDDAVGEAFDKVARILGLPYPGGPEISKLAEKWQKENKKGLGIKLPRPMIHSGDLDFSFSGLKTAVLYTVKKIPTLTDDIKEEIAYEFENAVAETIVSKIEKAVSERDIKSIVVGGGVIANKRLREELKKTAEKLGVEIFIPEISHSTDNALMIATVCGAKISFNKEIMEKNQDLNWSADGNWRVDK
jgi:tRNA A37 threonylcarbamoyltransferase TsaD